MILNASLGDRIRFGFFIAKTIIWKKIDLPLGGHLPNAIFSPDGSLVAVWATKYSDRLTTDFVQVFSTVDGKSVTPIWTHVARISRVRFSPSGDVIAIVGGRVWPDGI